MQKSEIQEFCLANGWEHEADGSLSTTIRKGQVTAKITLIFKERVVQCWFQPENGPMRRLMSAYYHMIQTDERSGVLRGLGLWSYLKMGNHPDPANERALQVPGR